MDRNGPEWIEIQTYFFCTLIPSQPNTETKTWSHSNQNQTELTTIAIRLPCNEGQGSKLLLFASPVPLGLVMGKKQHISFSFKPTSVPYGYLALGKTGTMIVGFFFFYWYFNQGGSDPRESPHKRKEGRSTSDKLARTSGKKAHTSGKRWCTQGENCGDLVLAS